MTALEHAQQGHVYQHGDARVLAMENGPVVEVREIVPGSPWLGPAYRVQASALTRLPMAYFHGSVPE